MFNREPLVTILVIVGALVGAIQGIGPQIGLPNEWQDIISTVAGAIGILIARGGVNSPRTMGDVIAGRGRTKVVTPAGPSVFKRYG